VVEEALTAIQKNKARHYPGKKIAFMAAVMSSVPVFLLRKMMSRRPRRSQSS